MSSFSFILLLLSSTFLLSSFLHHLTTYSYFLYLYLITRISRIIFSTCPHFFVLLSLIGLFFATSSTVMSQEGTSSTEEVDGVVAVVASLSAKKSHRRPESPTVVVVPAVPEYRVRPEREDGVALLTDAEPPDTREHVDIFAPSQLLTNSFEERLPSESCVGYGDFSFVP